MTRRMFNEDTYSLGLLYLYKYSNKEQKMALLDDLKKFHQAIENILEENNSKSYNLYRTMLFDNEIYFTSSNKDGETYCILKPDLNIQKVETMYIDAIPKEHLSAAESNNALKYLGLIKVNEKIIYKNAFYNELIEKYKLKYELPTRYPKLDITEQYNSIVENGFIEKFCLTKEEKSIVKALRNQEKSFQKSKKCNTPLLHFLVIYFFIFRFI